MTHTVHTRFFARFFWCTALFIISGCLFLFGLLGCKGASTEKTTPGEASRQSRVNTGIPTVRGFCEGDQNRWVDLDNNGRANIVYSMGPQGALQCSAMDLNLDGVADLTRFYETDGVRVRREEKDYDYDGILDELSYYENGVLVRKELDTNFDNIVDTWLWCTGPYVARAQHDRFRRGQPDTWITYREGWLIETRHDTNFDGIVDHWEVFRRGLLVKTRQDNNNDGQPDQEENIAAAEAGTPSPRMFCTQPSTSSNAETSTEATP